MRFGKNIRLSTLALFALVLGGCARVPRDAGFADVEALVGGRLPQRVEWSRGTADDAAADATVDEMLGGELDADAAVQVALLNNKDLQATYESLAVAQADLVEAGLLLNPVFDAQVRFGTSGGGTGIDLGVIQDFLDVFQIPLRKRVSAANFEATKSRVAGEVVDLAAETRRTYFQLVAALQAIELRQTVVDAYAAGYDVAKRLHDAGNTTDLALAREQGQYGQGKLDLAASEVDARVRRERLAALMGVWGERAEYYRRVLMPIRQTVVDQTQLTYNAMPVGPFQLLQAKRDQVEAATAYIAALEAYWLARTTLEQILAGRGGVGGGVGGGFPQTAPAETASPAMTGGGDQH